MSDILVLVHTGVAIAVIILLIMVARIGPVISLLAGSIYLGLAAGLGFQGTTEALATGFGDIMASVGLIIAMGVLLGSLLAEMGTLQSIVDKLLRLFAPRKLPLASSVTLTTFFPVIYGDVLLVLMAPLVRSLAPRMGKGGMAKMSTALAIGINVGLVFVVPGAAAIAIAGLLDVPLGLMLVAGILVAIPTAVLTILIYGWLVNRGLWNPAKDEMAVEGTKAAVGAGQDEGTTSAAGHGGSGAGTDAEPAGNHHPPLRISLLPVLIALVLVSAGVVAKIAGVEGGFISFIGDPVIAIFIALVSAYLLAWGYLTKERADSAISNGFRESGIVLIITGVGGSLAAVIGKTGLENILGDYFSAGILAPLFLAWLIAVILEIALGSATVAIITAGGILAPVLGSLDVPTVLVALAASSGALFGIHLNSNFFWIFQPLLGLSTQGTLKTLTLPISIASVISLGLIMAASLVL
ncbi:GntP family permease [Arthrobacter castelli]|uniref:GntP family permease n=1 Tax=Arthrobacter castelli TaxID=271431 RepID=UPI00041DC222|nr:SLC13 family permease [Arthrobacter castelli]